MARHLAGVNEELLEWARTRAGYTVEEVAQRLKKDPGLVRRWERGHTVPTYGQLEYLAYTLYKCPLAVFFLPRRPEEPEPRQEFRTLPRPEIESLPPDARLAVREAFAMQLSLEELSGGVNPSEKKLFRDVPLDVRHPVEAAATRLRAYLGVPLSTQTGWRTIEEALETWRDRVQDHGVFVFKRSFEQEGVSGFCLSHHEFPIIYLNNSEPKTRQVFTLFHELAHVLLGTSSVTKVDDRYVASLKGASRAIEVFCNRFTSEYLVPSADFELRFEPNNPVDQEVGRLAAHYKVSRLVILRRLRDSGSIEQPEYADREARYKAEYEHYRKRAGRRGDYYSTQASYLGGKFLTFAFAKYHQGRCTLEDLAHFLNIKVKHLPGLEELVLGKGTR